LLLRYLLRKKNETELQNKTEGKSSRIEQTEDRISELEDEMVIKGKTEELLIKQLKTCGKKMKELTDSIKRPNLRITKLSSLSMNLRKIPA
jgi:predicted nuclease with TOPRIM domain